MEQFNGIRNIIFDLGGVLLGLDFEAPVRAFEQLGQGGHRLDYRQALADSVFLKFEVGEITPQQFRSRMREILDNPLVSDLQIDEAWCAMLLDIPEEKIALLKKLAGRFRLFLFSNTNVIHISHLRRQFMARHGFSFEELFEKVFYSHEIHDRKPLLSSFCEVLGRAGVEAAETLFIDDFEQNTEAARKVGLRVFHLHPELDLAQFFNGFSK